MDRKVIFSDKSLIRPRYFPGKLLTAEDFDAEQEYFLAKLRQHNRHLHGWGVVNGLEVFIRDQIMVVTPGYAIDCTGNEIWLKTKFETRLSRRKQQFNLVIEYFEEPIAPIPTLSTNPATDPQESGFIQEGCRCELRENDPVANHKSYGPGSPGCGKQHAITIASLKMGPRGWQVHLRARR